MLGTTHEFTTRQAGLFNSRLRLRAKVRRVFFKFYLALKRRSPQPKGMKKAALRAAFIPNYKTNNVPQILKL
jgi:hypothetical protein